MMPRANRPTHAPSWRRFAARPSTALVAIALALVAPELPRAWQPPAPPATQRPTLLVMVVVDQMRFEYLDRYQRFWTAGFRRLRDEGAVFDQTFYPYQNTVTCAGHATIGTGAFPATHGVILNEWWHRDLGKSMSCTNDPTVTSLPYAPPAEPIGHSTVRLRVPTLGDRLRQQSPSSRVVTLSMKPRSTVMLAGKGGTAVTWFADTNVWATSTAYTGALVPEVKAFLDAHPVERDRAVIWDRLLPADTYTGSDDVSAERPPRGRGRTFPHPLAGVPSAPPADYFNLWERSPYSDAYLGEMTAAMVQAFALGQRGHVDLLGVSFSGLDYVGHDFGPDSHEVQDTLLRLDRTVGRLLDALDQQVGRGRYVLGLSADHGVAQIPEITTAAGGSAGRVTNAQVRKVAEAAMVAAYGPGPHVAHVEYSNIYLSEAMRNRAATDATVLDPLITALGGLPGVLRVMPSRGLETKHDSTDPVERAAALSYYPGESGDVTLVLQPNWVGTDSSAATHGTQHAYDQHVPLVFFGATVKPGRYPTPATPADLAATLASVVGIPMPGVEGRAQRVALIPVP